MNSNVKPLVIFELANNHGGDLEHGRRIVRECAEAAEGFDFDFAVKFQYRSPGFVHPAYRDREDHKYAKRFRETRLEPYQYEELLDEVRRLGWKAICTPFDEVSVDLIEKQGFDILKIASCSFTDWPLLERVARVRVPVIASTAGATLDEIDRVVSFFEHRHVDLTLMHCVGEYPTLWPRLQLNQVDLLRQRYPGLRIGFSSHEAPNMEGSTAIAYAKGARVFERHVDVPRGGKMANGYSVAPSGIADMLSELLLAVDACGTTEGRHHFGEKEIADLRQFRRGVYAKRRIEPGEVLEPEDVFFAFPNHPGQLVTNDLQKYTRYTARAAIDPASPLMEENLVALDQRPLVVAAVNRLRELLIASAVALPERVEIELSHHYGLDRFDEIGAVLVNVINREYCKKLIVVLPGQMHPFHRHEVKEETFHVLHGEALLEVAGEVGTYKKGDLVTVERGAMHRFGSTTGAVLEEISTTAIPGDSYYEDPGIAQNPYRKTRLTFWPDWLDRAVV